MASEAWSLFHEDLHLSPSSLVRFRGSSSASPRPGRLRRLVSLWLADLVIQDVPRRSLLYLGAMYRLGHSLSAHVRVVRSGSLTSVVLFKALDGFLSAGR